MKTIEEQLILHEGLYLKPYICPAGYWTIGVGRNLEGVGLHRREMIEMLGDDNHTRTEVISLLKDRGITKDEALVMLGNDIRIAERDLATFPWYANLDPIRRKVMIDMRFNLGPTRFRGFRRMIANLKAGSYSGAADEMIDSKWYHEVGNRSKRLVEMMRTGQDYER